jgi:hypothetical protein
MIWGFGMSALAYIGVRQHTGCTVLAIDDFARASRPLAPRRDLANHSPDGFEWGHGGSGPAQLALALLADHLADDDTALRLHQRFKWSVIAPLREPRWALRAEDLKMAVAQLRRFGLDVS